MLTRRALLAGAGAAGASLLAAALSRTRAATNLPEAPPVVAGPLREFDLAAAEHPGTAIPHAAESAKLWLYNGEPFHTLRVKLGERMQVRFVNRLPQHSAIHWHGIRVPVEMDGVQYVTQPPVEPGEAFTYEFTPPDTGTFFFHSHCNGPEQMGRGLLGVLIVEGDELEPFHAEHVLALKDWRLDEAGNWLPFFTKEGAGRAGTFGTVRTVNGVENYTATTPASADIRVRVLNLDPTRMIDLGVEGAEAFVIATDGNAVEPFPLHTWRMGSAMRVDLHIRTPKPGGTFRLFNYFSPEPFLLATFTAEGPERAEGPAVSKPLYASHAPKANIAAAERKLFQFSAAAGAAASIVNEFPPNDPLARQLLDSLCAGNTGLWAINKAQWPTDGHRALPPPLALLEDGRSYIFEIVNGTPHPHPIHLHGQTFEVLSASRQELPQFQADTVMVQPRERVEIAFVAARGSWMFHCHILEHQENGMMGWLRVS